ncbi:amidohydrolase [Zoogloea sp.]|uniref:amidohydrolase n=1 Tax=Zoogloea sp. TaxID=49181 RepID=UPI0035B04F40
MKRLLPWGLLLGLSFHPAAQGQTTPDSVQQTPPSPTLSDLILTNGDVLTLDERKPSAQAVAIKGARIVAVGRTKEILARWKSDSTEVVDLGGKTLIPGFIESWGEMSRLGLQSVAAPLQSPPAGSVMDLAGLQRQLRDWARGELATRFGWIIGYGFDHTQLREQRPLSNKDLDAVSRDKPILIVHASGQQVVLNSKALELAGITRDSQAPANGQIGRWPGSREPDGVLEGSAAALVLGQLPTLPSAERLAMIEQGQTLYLRNGYTTTQEGRATPTDLELYRQAADNGVLRLDVVLNADQDSRPASAKPLGNPYYRNRVRLNGVSLALDGSVDDRSAWLSSAYQLPPPGKRAGFAGYQRVSDDALATLLGQAASQGWSPAILANGDAAIGQALGQLENTSPRPPRPMLVGAQTMTTEQLGRLANLGGSVAMAPRALGPRASAWTSSLLGAERTQRTYPLAAARDAKVPLMLYTDPQEGEPAPLGAMAAALARPVGPEQQISALDALKALTLVPARQIGEERNKGSIAPGKLADLTLLSANPLYTPPAQLGSIKVLGVIKEGETVYGSTGAPLPMPR